MATNEHLKAETGRWLAEFESALQDCDTSRLAALFVEDSSLRDSGALTFDYRQFHGRDALTDRLLKSVEHVHPTNMRFSVDWPVPEVRDDPPVVSIFFTFEVKAGEAVGLLHGVPDPSSRFGFLGRALYTRLEQVRGTPHTGVHPRGRGFVAARAGENWLEARTRRQAFEDTDPQVLVVGAGQAGVMTGAYLQKLGVPYLIVDSNAEAGDNWRKRYRSLTLHNPIEMNGFPLLRYPEHYPQYLSRDLVADWLKIYSSYFDLDIWFSTRFAGADYDDGTGTWVATVVTSADRRRELHPQHIVLASGGIGGKPNIPDLPGMATFTGHTMHSSAFTDASEWVGKKAIVVGMGSSGHDIALDLASHGSDVTMIQRGPIMVQNIDTANQAYAGYFDGTPTDHVDLQYGVGLIQPLRLAASKEYHARAKVMDADLLAGLRAAGVRLHDGYQGAGWLDLYLRTGGGYYLNVGASEAIIDGTISVVQADRIASFVPGGLRLDDETVLEADLVVLATGYQNRQAEVEDWFGVDVACRIGPIARLDSEGEWANMWGQTAQPGLWFNGGGLNQVRPGSKVLTNLIKADLDGLIPSALRRTQQRHPVRP